tara:strand:- start:766 stop:1995 length:1230 start_codon:yes stop_codon:yes gene_type:complete
MAIKTRMYFSFFRATYIFFASALLAQEPQNISGTLTDTNNDPVVQNTILLLKPDGTEHKRTETSKKRLGRGGGKFEFKDVEPGNYTIQSDGGELGSLNLDLEVINTEIKLGDIKLSLSTIASENTSSQNQEMLPEMVSADTPTEPKSQENNEQTNSATENAAANAFTPDPNKDYILNELSFEIKKMTAEVKYLNEELEDLKALSKMWVNPLAIYSKEIIMKNGSTVFGKIVYQDEEQLKVESLVGYLIINRSDVVRIVDNVVTEEQAEYVPEQVRDSYTPPPMPKLAQPQYTSAERSNDKKYSANCVLVGNITEKKDAQGNIVFNGEIKNIGGRRSDFVKVDFVFRKNWSGETKTLTTFVRGGYHTFDSGITTDATLLPGATGAFELYVPNDFGSFIGYSYVIDWEEYE